MFGQVVGQLDLELDQQVFRYDVSGLAPGTYLIKIREGREVIGKSFVKASN